MYSSDDLHYDSLSDVEKALICNGCGGKGGWINVPDFMFEASCDHHDFRYWVGGTEADRKSADVEFYQSMKKDAGSNVYYRFWAYCYYLGVRFCGKKYFQYGEKKKRSDLEKEIAAFQNRMILSRQ